MVANWVALAFEDFGMAMFILALLFIAGDIIIHLKSVDYFEIIFRWIALFSLGFTGIYAAIMHAFFPTTSAQAIGWPMSPFQFEVAMADLAIGVLGLMAFKYKDGFRLATVIASTCFFWGDAIGHIFQMLVHSNFTRGNAGSWFWLDILVPLILIICYQKMYKPTQVLIDKY